MTTKKRRSFWSARAGARETFIGWLKWKRDVHVTVARLHAGGRVPARPCSAHALRHVLLRPRQGERANESERERNRPTLWEFPDECVSFGLISRLGYCPCTQQNLDIQTIKRKLGYNNVTG